jgi:TonB family protein
MSTDLVSSSIIARQREPEGFQRMLMISGAGHVIAIAALVALHWLAPSTREPDAVMVLTLGPGAAGPPSGGMRARADQAVQQEAPKPALPRPEPPRPPAPRQQEMVENTTKPTTKPQTPVKQPAQSSRQAPPTTGEQVRPGQASVKTGTQSTEAGLSTGGGAAGDNSLANFCDPEYLGQMVGIINRNWTQQRQSVPAKPIIRFVIQRDGSLTDVTVRQSSGYPLLDFTAKRAVDLTRAIPPLPSCYPHPDFAVNMTFEYIR